MYEEGVYLVPDHAIRRFADLATLSRAAAATFAALAAEAIALRGRYTAVLAGGRTPAQLHRLLATEYHSEIDWTRVHIFFGDERYLPHSSPLSNYHMARETLLDHVPVPMKQIHPMPTEPADPDQAANAYDAYLRDTAPIFDLLLLGMGADGHTASLFPGAPAVNECDRWVVPVKASAEPPIRLTLTRPALAMARRTLFLVDGAEKRPVWQEIKADPVAAAERYPAARVAMEARQVAWYLTTSVDSTD